ncbi:hypothetical protein PENTCL1PPCAC_30316 [Pristionchus entomophagus]|uniref:G protein-coupled receptor n=1 Tax=Pristionchus entomophagus TaxID=358040 RepID=A0AAV5UPD9_9BILA|nr:hypothetical protein PENTCL1PPCAC_26261 [Pristionchus entomophagus]GMT08142.1 hypothetical protein PENTCL1PPCAC_30316 [Pristionchus entomophagus]
MQHHHYELPPPPYPSTDAAAMPQLAAVKQPHFPMQQSPLQSTTRLPMQKQSNASNEASRRQLPYFWKPFGCCGLSNATSTRVILALILVGNVINFYFAMTNVNNGAVDVVLYLLSGGMSLIQALAAIVVLVQIYEGEGKTTGLSILLDLLFMDYFIYGLTYVWDIMQICFFNGSFFPTPAPALYKDEKMTVLIISVIVCSILYLPLFLLNKLFRKVLSDYCKEMQMHQR